MQQFDDGPKHVKFGVRDVFVCADRSKRRSSKKPFTDGSEGLPDIAEAEAVLLDLARVFSDPATGRAYVLDNSAEEGKGPVADVHAPNLEAKYRRCWSKYLRSSSWLISTEGSAKRM